MLVALMQIAIQFEDIESNKRKVEEMMEEAGKADLVIFPEMTLTGFTMNHLIDKSIIPFFDFLAAKYHTTIMYGFIEEGYYNSCNITNGKVITTYRKIHPFLEESKYYQKGDQLVSFQIDEFTIVPTICYDLRFPVLYLAASKLGNVIVDIASWPSVRDEHWLSLLKARAIENQCYMIGVNRTGDDYCGHSVVFDGWGNQLTELTSEEKVIYCEIKKKEYPSQFTKDQRIDLYIKLMEK